jgi:hypothetical protein
MGGTSLEQRLSSCVDARLACLDTREHHFKSRAMLSLLPINHVLAYPLEISEVLADMK